MPGDKPVPRVLPTDEMTELMAAVVAILTVPPLAEGRLDALAVPIGQGEEWRLRHAIGVWESDPAIRFLLVANGNPAERTYVAMTPGYLRQLGLRRLDGVCVQPQPAPNTGLQAAWIAEQVWALGVRSLALAVSPYHLPRAYLTVLKALADLGVRIPLIPAAVPVPPHHAAPETSATGYDLVPGEMRRILRYADAGWLSTAEELRVYLAWLWAQSA
jgi:hypothetical protein